MDLQTSMSRLVKTSKWRLFRTYHEVMSACLEDSDICIPFGKGFEKWDRFRNLRWYHFRGSSDIHVQIGKDFKVDIVLNK